MELNLTGSTACQQKEGCFDFIVTKRAAFLIVNLISPLLLNTRCGLQQKICHI